LLLADGENGEAEGDATVGVNGEGSWDGRRLIRSIRIDQEGKAGIDKRLEIDHIHQSNCASLKRL